MKYSLLYKNPEQREIFDVIYDLSIDRAVHTMCPDIKRADYFLTVLMKPLFDIENILYRQDILRDFLEIPQLYEDIKIIFSRYDKIKNDWREMRSGAYPSGSSINRRALLDYTFASLKVTAMFPKTIMSFFKSIASTLAKYDIKSSGLNDIMKYCTEITENDSLNEIARIASLFQYKTPENFEFSIMSELDDTLKMISCDLSDIKEIDDKTTENIFTKLFLRKKRDDVSIIAIEDDEATTDDVLNIANEALHRIDASLTQVTNDVYEIFFGISNELLFYDAALSISDYLSGVGARTVFPAVCKSEDDIFEAKNLCDPILISEDISGKDIIGNDAEIEKSVDGILIRGQNKTGKTSYLRAVGIAQLFAQCGLPICADDAHISIRRGIYTHFSSAEEDFRAGDTAGRFESEVQVIAKIIDGVEKHPYSLILLNETFQTTSYSEGAQGMNEILSVLPMANAKYVFVSRLSGLFELADKDRVKIITMDDKFKANFLN